MVEQGKARKTSSITSNYKLKSFFTYDSLRVATASARDVHIYGLLDPTKHLDQERWRDVPHKAFANLRLEPRSVQAFIKMYGLLFSADTLTPGERDSEIPELHLEDAPGFHENVKHFASAQDLLRRAWMGDLLSVTDIEGEIEGGFEIETVQVHYGYIVLKTSDLWKYICFLFSLDEAHGSLQKCHNPDCPAPFFIARRRTQKFCELGPCTAYAQRQYSNKWWRDKGTKKRAKKQSQAKRRSKQ